MQFSYKKICITIEIQKKIWYCTVHELFSEIFLPNLTQLNRKRPTILLKSYVSMYVSIFLSQKFVQDGIHSVILNNNKKAFYCECQPLRNIFPKQQKCANLYIPITSLTIFKWLPTVDSTLFERAACQPSKNKHKFCKTVRPPQTLTIFKLPLTVDSTFFERATYQFSKTTPLF